MAKIKYTVVDKILKKGYPTSSKHYKTAHEAADKVEKKTYPKGYSKMKTVDDKLKSNELAGTHSKSGKIEVSKKVPKSERQEVALHEYVEHEKDPGRCKKCGAKKVLHKLTKM